MLRQVSLKNWNTMGKVTPQKTTSISSKKTVTASKTASSKKETGKGVTATTTNKAATNKNSTSKSTTTTTTNKAATNKTATNKTSTNKTTTNKTTTATNTNKTSTNKTATTTNKTATNKTTTTTANKTTANKTTTNKETTTAFKVGSSGSAVRNLQSNLNQLGYYVGTLDGKYGNTTKNAVASFQKNFGLKNIDGVADSSTITAINLTVERRNNHILSKGQVSNDVKIMQSNLRILGYFTGEADGVFGTSTEAAVRFFQTRNRLTADGMANANTRNVLNDEIRERGIDPDREKRRREKIVSNLKNDTTLKLTNAKKTAIIKVAEGLLNKGFEATFVAGVLGNIQSEGSAGEFENSNYITNKKKKRKSLQYMDDNFDYLNKFSGKSIKEVGIKAAMNLAKEAQKSNPNGGEFGLGMVQWTGSRTIGVLQSYEKYASGDKPTDEECITAEVNFIIAELNGAFKNVYEDWRKEVKLQASTKKGISLEEKVTKAGEMICKKYEKPVDMENQAKVRAENAVNIYSVMTT